jgi:hypothetical protein
MHFGHGQSGQVLGGITFFPSSVRRRLASQAWAIIDNVMRQYQLG